MLTRYHYLFLLLMLLPLTWRNAHGEEQPWLYMEVEIGLDFALKKSIPRPAMLPYLSDIQEAKGLKDGTILLMGNHYHTDKQEQHHTDTYLVRITSEPNVIWARQYTDRSLYSITEIEGEDEKIYASFGDSNYAILELKSGDIIAESHERPPKRDEVVFFADKTTVVDNKIVADNISPDVSWMLNTHAKKLFNDIFIDYDNSVSGMEVYRLDNQGNILKRHALFDYQTDFDLIRPGSSRNTMAPSYDLFNFSRYGSTDYLAHLSGGDHSLYLLTESETNRSSALKVQHLIKFAPNGKKLWEDKFSFNPLLRSTYLNYFVSPFISELISNGESYIVITDYNLYVLHVIDNKGKIVKSYQDELDLPECCYAVGIKESSPTKITFFVIYRREREYGYSEMD